MDTIKEILTISNESHWYDYENISELNSLRKYLIDYFYDIIPQERLLISLNIIDNIILKIYDNDTQEINNEIFKLREQILYMLSFQKTIKDDQWFLLLLKNIYNHLLILYLSIFKISQIISYDKTNTLLYLSLEKISPLIISPDLYIL